MRQTLASPYSTDENLWGRSIEAGILEDPWVAPPEDVFEWTKSLDQTPDKPSIVEIRFEQGVPVALDGEPLGPVAIVERLNAFGGEHGIGRIDMIENRLVGIKSREIYESPAAVILLEAHQILEQLTLTKQQVRFKDRVGQEYADLVYNGLWFTSHHRDLAQYVASTQRHVTGDVKLRLWHGTMMVQGRRAEKSLYSQELATYNNIDELMPYTERSSDLYYAKQGGRHNSSFAKIPLVDRSSRENYLANIFFSEPPLERIQKLRFKLRYHDGRPVHFHGLEFNFSMELTTLRNESAKNFKVNKNNYALS